MISKVSILIPVYNRLQTTIQGLRSLFAALDYYRHNGRKEIEFTVIVIDDASTDGTPEWISANYDEVHLINTEGNLWWTGAVNRGAEYVINLLSDYLLLWNDDVYPAEKYFLIVENLIRSGLCEGTIIGSKIMFSDSTKTWSNGGFFNRFTGNLGMKTMNTSADGDLIECDWQPGMGTLIPVRSILSAGLKWDEKHFPHYSGDSDFTLRCKSKGLRICTCPDLVIYNNTSATGFVRKRDLKDIWMSFTSLKSIYNVKINLRFYTRHGILPFAYFGMLLRYFYYLGGFVKHSILRRQHREATTEFVRNIKDHS